MTVATAESVKEKNPPTSAETMDDLTMVSLLWMGASADAMRHHIPKGIARVHTLGFEDDDPA